MTHQEINDLDTLACEFEVAWKSGRPEAFSEFVEAILSHRAAGFVSSFDAARYVAGSMFVPGIDDDPLRAEIVALAGSLETQDQAEAQHVWERLNDLVEELRRSNPQPP